MKNFSKEVMESINGLEKEVKNIANSPLCKTQKKLGDRLIKMLSGEVIEGVFQVLLELMALSFSLDKDYRRNIEHFNAEMVFTDTDKDFYVVTKFKDGKMSVSDKKAKNPAFVLSFKSEKALMDVVLSGVSNMGAPDILNAMLNQKVDFTGNINYMNKFAYMALHLVLNLTNGAVYAK